MYVYIYTPKNIHILYLCTLKKQLLYIYDVGGV